MEMGEEHPMICVLEFSTSTSSEACDWLTEKVKEDKIAGGAGLIASECTNQIKQRTLHLSITPSRLLEVAEYMRIKKLCQDGTLREFSRDTMDVFENCDNVEALFTKAERQRMILHELESIHATATSCSVPGYSNIKMHHGQSIVRQCVHHGVISQIFPLHDLAYIHKLRERWYHWKNLFKPQPLKNIRGYFGQTIAVYFAFLNFYTYSLFIPTILGISYWLTESATSRHGPYVTLAYSATLVVWASAFVELWKRRASELAYSWGSSESGKSSDGPSALGSFVEEPRANFYGELGVNPVTGKSESQFPRWKKNAWYFGISLPVVLACLIGACCVLGLYLWCERQLLVMLPLTPEDGRVWYHTVVSFVPTVVYSGLIIAMNKSYRPLAVWLNEKENHRLQSSFENHLILKLVSFWFINTFMCLFYIAFVQKNMASLRKTLMIELIVTQTVDQLQETVIPYLFYKKRKHDRAAHYDKDETDGADAGRKTREEKKDCQQLRRQAENESEKDVYLGTFDDYLELFIQFGYVCLFSSVFPLAALIALANNIIEVRTDATKLCKIHQRPFAQPASGIGAWLMVFEAMTVLAIVTNCMLIGTSPEFAGLWPQTGEVSLVVALVLVEHLLILIRVAIGRLIVDRPKWVTIAMARDEYQMKLAMAEQVKRQLGKTA